ncbi:MAG: tRNA epoxyqueuosine(34) reductase QueG, partial [Anaerolineaceae bacterium]|nr:tRNA epoxyqueuosine(34) reductase QueG [Anaerolineaceae bacterium]
MISLKEQIKAGALSLGFLDCAFTPALPVPGFEIYQKWIDEERHAEMAYLASPSALERRADPRQLLPSVKTVISLVSGYPPPSHSAKKTSGKIVAYALQHDYHEQISERLKQLVVLIEALSGEQFDYLACVDSSPILEKAYAQKAGLGWIGRNSLLLHPEFGSWIHLSELLVSLEIEADKIYVEDGCGDCQLCVRACPTQAILPNRTVDARRCLSYLSIENRAEIPIEHRKAMGNRIFGCDQCQMVCPVNKKSKLT